jgi:hypothetical protein
MVAISEQIELEGCFSKFSISAVRFPVHVESTREE